MHSSVDHAPEQAAAAFSPGALATAVADDAGVALFVIGADLCIKHANAHARACLQTRAERFMGLPLSSIFPASIAREYTDAANQACADNEPIDLLGMIGGVWRRLTFRPVTFADERCVLITSPPPSERRTTINGRTTLRTTRDELGQLKKLTSRELEILRLIGLGLNTTQIADTLSRSIKTVDGHLLSIRTKIGQLTRTELAARAIEAGLTRIDDEEVRRISRQARAESHPHA